jgi:hypothetical protein
MISLSVRPQHSPCAIGVHNLACFPGLDTLFDALGTYLVNLDKELVSNFQLEL